MSRVQPDTSILRRIVNQPVERENRRLALREAALGEEREMLTIEKIREDLATAREATRRTMQVNGIIASDAPLEEKYKALLSIDPAAAEALRSKFNADSAITAPAVQQIPEFSSTLQMQQAPLPGDEAMPTPQTIGEQTVALPAQPRNYMGMGGGMSQIANKSARQVIDEQNAALRTKQGIETEAKVAEQEAASALRVKEDRLKPLEAAPGTLIINRDASGKEISRETVPFKPETSSKPASIQEYEFAKSEGYKGSYQDYQNLDANRRRQMVNINLEKLRELDLENKTDASPGQVVFKNSGRPVGTALPESAAARLEGIQTAIQQSDVVEKALLKLGSSGAVKGYIEENGVYWPVVQDALSAEQAAAVSETNRLLSAYAQAVSGLAVSEPEIRRLQRSAPSVKLTPEANKVILGHFKRNAIAKRDNYLDIRGWKLKEAESAGDVEELERGPDGKLRRKAK